MFIGIVILVGYAAHLFSKRTKIPESLIMILMGLAIGPIFGLVNPDNFKGMAGVFATLAIIIILIDSGLDFEFKKVLKRMYEAAVFTIIVNILITFAIGISLHFIFNWPILHALLLGIICSGTTTVMVQSLLEGLKINAETKHLLVLESIFNDTSLIIISVVIIDLIKQRTTAIVDSVFLSIQSFLVQISLGILFGIIFFIIWLEIVRKIPVEKKRDYVLILGILFTAYGILEVLGGSGVIFVLVFSLLLGNQKSILKRLGLNEKYHSKEHVLALKSIKIIQLDFSFFIKTFFFIFLGLITDLSLITPKLLLITFSIITVMFLARYISAMFISRLNYKHQEHVFLISTMMPRGFVATLLAFLPYNEGIQIPLFTEIVLLLIIFTSFVSIFGAIHQRIKSSKAY